MNDVRERFFTTGDRIYDTGRKISGIVTNVGIDWVVYTTPDGERVSEDRQHLRKMRGFSQVRTRINNISHQAICFIDDEGMLVVKTGLYLVSDEKGKEFLVQLPPSNLPPGKGQQW